MSALFLLLLTIVLYGLGKAVIGMTFSKKSHEDEPKEIVKLSWTMYLPQVVMLILAFVIGVYMPTGLSQMVLTAVAGF